MNDSSKVTSEIMSLILMGVLFLSMLTLVVFSASAYRASVQVQAGNDDLRAALGYVATAVKQNGTDDIRLEDIDGVPTLVITDRVSGLEQRVYYRDGEILENYGAVGYGFSPGGETVIGRADVFEMTLIGDSLLKIETNLGTSLVNLSR
ncbi:MAG: DUF4860 domain-containing protein [Bacillota bacterium]|jgi:hypothetical protein